MNKPIRKIAIALGVLFAAMFVNLNFVQVVKAKDYRDNPQNRRVLLNEYKSPRGPIVVQGTNIAQSTSTKDQLKYLRTYLDGPVYAPVTGIYSFIYGTGFSTATTGIEATENDVLSGHDQRLIVAQFTGLFTGRDPKGGSVQLTLNKAAQQAAYDAMKGTNGQLRRGAVVALDPVTGAILAAVSTPSYDPNLFSSHDPAAIARAYDSYCQPDAAGNCAPDGPLLNRAFDEIYAPGSVFKVIDAAAALSAGVKPETRIPAPNGYWPFDAKRTSACPSDPTSSCVQNFEGETCDNGVDAQLQFAFAKSCNTAFAALAVDRLGATRLADEARLFGLDAGPLRVPLAVAQSTIGNTADLSDRGRLSHTSFGQQDVRVTPLQAAMISAAVANHGTLMKPYLIDKELGPNLSTLSQTTPTQLSQVIDANLDAELMTMMQCVITCAEGTGGAANITDLAGVTVGGKTGTADTGQYTQGASGSSNDWFSGYALQGSTPRIAVAVILENGNQTGGQASAPIAKAVMEAYLRSLGGH